MLSIKKGIPNHIDLLLSSLMGIGQSLGLVGPNAVQKEVRKSGGDLLMRKPATRVVPLVSPVAHAEESQASEFRIHIAEVTRLHSSCDDSLDRLSVRVSVSRNLFADPWREFALVFEKDSNVTLVGVNHSDYVPDYLPQLFRRVQVRPLWRLKVGRYEAHELPMDKNQDFLLTADIVI